MNIHHLDGCAPTPLAHYLKALGILRIVAEQADPEARGWWSGDRFRLATKLDGSELKEFFLQRYEPTPVFNPWGGRSGFYPEPPEKTARGFLNAIEATLDERFKAYRETVSEIRETIKKTTGGSKPEGDEKDRLILALRRTIRGKGPLWMEAVVSLVGSDNQLKSEQPALLGTGGNEGSGSYTAAYMSAIDQCLLRRNWDHALTPTLFMDDTRPKCEWDQSMGQFVPGGPANPWDLLLAFEGACVISSAVCSRNSTVNSRWLSSPFYVAPRSYGYASEGRLDEVVLKRGNQLPGRGEQWFPLWPHPILYQEIHQIFAEGRAATRRGHAADSWSMLRAVSSFGIRQGIHEFVRFGYQQRNNMATHFAVPLGRFKVSDRRSPKLACLDDLDTWVESLRRQARSKSAPARLQAVERRLSDSLFAVVHHPDEPVRWQQVLLAMSDVEAVLRTGAGFEAGPIPPLRPEWVSAADDGSPSIRLATAFALQWPSIRCHWLPLKGASRFAVSGKHLEKQSDVVMQGRSGIEDAIAIVRRRLVRLKDDGNRELPLNAGKKMAAIIADISLLLAGQVDLDHTLQLARALTALDSWRWSHTPCPPKRPIGSFDWPDDAWLAIRLSLLPFPLPAIDRQIPADPAIFRRLESGDASSAVQLALQRLSAAGVRTTVRAAATSPQTSRLWAAALAFPISQKAASLSLNRLDPNFAKESTP